MKLRAVALAFACSLTAGSASAATDYIVNGSFEAAGPNLAAGGGSFCYRNYAPLECGSLPSWQTSSVAV